MWILFSPVSQVLSFTSEIVIIFSVTEKPFKNFCLPFRLSFSVNCWNSSSLCEWNFSYFEVSYVKWYFSVRTSSSDLVCLSIFLALLYTFTMKVLQTSSSVIGWPEYDLSTTEKKIPHCLLWNLWNFGHSHAFFHEECLTRG
jgi:hypothetical protein